MRISPKSASCPCAPEGPNRCPENVLNEWNGFQMYLYKPRKEHVCEGDIIDRFFTEVYGDQQKKFLLDLFAFYIRFPWIRTGRLSVVKGEEGSGKTTLFHFLELVIGRNLCKKSNNLVAYLSKFSDMVRRHPRRDLWSGQNVDAEGNFPH